MKLLSHDLNAFWCVRLPSRDAKSMLNVATILKTAAAETLNNNFKLVALFPWQQQSFKLKIQIFGSFASAGKTLSLGKIFKI